ncbi:hypothetical protein NYO91_11225, partial [Arhodomonas aquaeolei]|uniref:hypothetical protein n=1 Tax=Arhodomonas aquaeolei TaxID=2369 RepID=UPI00216A7D8F
RAREGVAGGFERIGQRVRISAAWHRQGRGSVTVSSGIGSPSLVSSGGRRYGATRPAAFLAAGPGAEMLGSCRRRLPQHRAHTEPLTTPDRNDVMAFTIGIAIHSLFTPGT